MAKRVLDLIVSSVGLIIADVSTERTDYDTSGGAEMECKNCMTMFPVPDGFTIEWDLLGDNSTDRFLLRNIMEYNTYNRTLGANLLFTYRVNSGTVLYLGYDDRYKQGDLLFDDDGEQLFFTTDFERTNRAFFTKISYLFRY